jgi:hypothetical protein
MDTGPLSSRHDPLDELLLPLLVLDELLDLLVSDGSIPNVVHHRVIEQHTVLGNDGDVGTEVCDAHLGNILAVDKNLPRGNVVKSVKKTHDGRLATACLADDSDGFTRGNGEGDVVNHCDLFLF